MHLRGTIETRPTGAFPLAMIVEALRSGDIGRSETIHGGRASKTIADAEPGIEMARPFATSDNRTRAMTGSPAHDDRLLVVPWDGIG